MPGPVPVGDCVSAPDCAALASAGSSVSAAGSGSLGVGEGELAQF